MAAIANGSTSALIPLTLLILLIFVLRRRRSKPKSPSTTTEEVHKSSTSLGVLYDKPELNAASAFAELLALEEEKARAEIAGTPIYGYEMACEEAAMKELPVEELYELPAREAVGSELASPGENEEKKWVFASEILSQVETMSSSDILSPAEAMSSLSPAGRRLGRLFFPVRGDGEEA
jgi:hypothetical protein